MFKAILRAMVCCVAIPGPALLAAAPDSVPFDRPLVFEPNLGQAPALLRSRPARSPKERAAQGPGECGRNEPGRKSLLGRR
jgi:hypothetical protein